jgi:hypothetical protein
MDLVKRQFKVLALAGLMACDPTLDLLAPPVPRETPSMPSTPGTPPRACNRASGETGRLATYSDLDRIPAALAADDQSVFLLDAFPDPPTPGRSRLWVGAWCPATAPGSLSLATEVFAWNLGGRPVLAMDAENAYVATQLNNGTIHRWSRTRRQLSTLATEVGSPLVLVRGAEELFLLSARMNTLELKTIQPDGGTTLLASGGVRPTVARLAVSAEGLVSWNQGQQGSFDSIVLWRSGMAEPRPVYQPDADVLALSLTPGLVWVAQQNQLVAVPLDGGVAQKVVSRRIEALAALGDTVFGSGRGGQFSWDSAGTEQPLGTVQSRLLSATENGLVVTSQKAKDAGGGADVFIVTP